MKQMREISDINGLEASYEPANHILPKDLPYITKDEATKAASLLIRKFGKSKDACPSRTRDMYSRPIIRKVWVCLSGNPSTLNRGWRRLIHDLAHRIFRYKSPTLPDHCKLQAEFEAKLVTYVKNSGWLQGKLKSKPKAKISNDDKKIIKITRLKANILRWETKMKRGNTYLKKYKAKLKRLTN